MRQKLLHRTIELMFGLMWLVVPTNVMAGACTSSNGFIDNGACSQAETNSENITCPSGSYAYYSCNGPADGGFGDWLYCWECHALGGGPETCPGECRQGSACGAGYSGASGCSGSGSGGGCSSMFCKRL